MVEVWASASLAWSPGHHCGRVLASPLTAICKRQRREKHSTGEVFEERYARGEISREEYLQKKRRLYKRVGKLLKPRTATLVTSPLPCE